MRRAAIVFGCIVVVGIAYACGDADNNPALNNSYGDADSGGGGSSGSSGNPGTDSGSSGGNNTDGGVDAGRDYSTDGSKFFGQSRCTTAGVLLCDGFETGTLDTTTWTVNGAAPTIDKQHAARGAYALHIQRTGNGASYIKETKTFPVLNNTYFGRAFVWFQQLPGNSATAGVDGGAFTYAHWTFVAASGTKQPGEIRLSGQLNNGKNLFGVGTDTGTDDAGSGDWTTSDNDPAGNPTAVPTGVWMCIEWEHDGANNETRFYWNATEHPSLHTTKTVNGGNGNPYILPDFTNVWIGWQEYQTTTEPFEMWVDEVAIDTSRIGCIL